MKEEDNEYEEYQYDQIFLVKMGLNAKINSTSDFESQDMDQNHNWKNDVQQHYSNNNIANVLNFIHQASNSSRNKVRENDNDSIDY